MRYLGVDEAAFTDDAFLILRSKHKARAKVQIPFEQIGGERCEIICERGLPVVPLLIAIINLTPLVHAENGDVVAADRPAKLLADGNNGPEGHAYSRPPEVEGEATNRAIMIADMAGVPVYVVHTSCEQAHEAIRRARQKGMRVYGEPLIQHLVLDESEYQNPDWDYAARRVMSPALPQQAASGLALGRSAVGFAAGGGDRPLRLHHGAEAQWHRQFRARSPTAPAASKTACPCSGPMASIPAG